MIDEMMLPQLENEPLKFYQLLIDYTYRGFGRNVSALARDYEISRKQIYVLMKKYNWLERIKRADEMIIKENFQTAKEKYKNAAEINLRNNIQLYEKVQTLFDKLIDKSEYFIWSGGELEETFARSNRFMNLMLKYQRFNKRTEESLQKTGLVEEPTDPPNDIEEIEIELENIEEASFEEIETEIHRILDKIEYVDEEEYDLEEYYKKNKIPKDDYG
jgi:hypothetical protein